MAASPPVTVFLFEYSTAGGAWGRWHCPELVAQLASEGRAMVYSLALDLGRAGYRVWLWQADTTKLYWRGKSYANTPQNRRAIFRAGCMEADAVWLIAPECGHIHWKLTQAAESYGAYVLSPNSTFVELTQDKHTTAEWLRERGVLAPWGWVVRRKTPTLLPDVTHWVRKPRLGAGSAGVERVTTAWIGGGQAAATSGRAAGRQMWGSGGWRIETYCPGTPVSVAAVCSTHPNSQTPFLCPPCVQVKSSANEFAHVAWYGPCPELHHLAQSLAHQAISHLPVTRGYVGLDLILNPHAPNGLGWVVDVNPRLTSSYVCLRKRFQGNLANAVLNICEGKPVRWQWRNAVVRVTQDDLTRLAAREARRYGMASA